MFNYDIERFHREIFRNLNKEENENNGNLIVETNSLLTNKILNEELSSEGLIEHAYDCLMNKETCYMWGGIMDVVAEDIISILSERYEDYYTEDKIARYESLIGKGVYGCDCSGLIKSYLFGGVNHPLYEELYDFNSSMMLYVSDRKGKIDTLPEIRGICLYMPGHVGIYAGKGQVVECTENERFGNGVVESNLMDRNWTDWFYCPFVTY